MLFQKLFASLILILLIAKNTVAQNVQDTNRYNKFYGSAKSLRGKVKVINCFISAGRKKWHADEKQTMLAKQAHANQWLIRQAHEWLIDDLSIDISNCGLENDIKVESIESDKEPANLFIDWVPMVLKAMGYPEPKYFYDSVKAADQADNIAVLVFAKKPGRCYAQTSGTDNPYHKRFLEGAVIYSEGFNDAELRDATIAHEFLHLFGAWDIYNSRLQTPDVEARAKALFPNSIMLATHRDLNPLSVEQMTAWCIGWIKVYWNWYEFYRPQKDKKSKEITSL